ncbi:MAG: type II toxin-antitoxin system VapC family toxin [Acidobacteria bacterium]|nr:type II toxin-antitoxin system VapC family toxin [Acidobacteriota bacterium]
MPESGSPVALDTSIAIDVLADDAHEVLSAGITEYLLPAPVVGELRYGALNSQKVDENLARVEGLITRCRVLDITATTADVYARLRLSLKRKGKPIPENDLWIAALCLEHDVKLADSDGHFDAVDGLKRWRPEQDSSEPDVP